MYINEFVCGIIATLGIEFLGLVVYALKIQKDKGKENTEECQNKKKDN
mgnify:CR=1 FL=1